MASTYVQLPPAASSATSEWTKYDFVYSQFSDAGTSKSVIVYSIPAKSFIEFVGVLVTDEVISSDGDASIVLTISRSADGSSNTFLTGLDITAFEDAANFYQLTGPTGATVFGFDPNVNTVMNYTSAENMYIKMEVSSGTLNNLTAGAFSVFVKSTTLP